MKPHSQLVPSAAPVPRPLTLPPYPSIYKGLWCNICKRQKGGNAFIKFEQMTAQKQQQTLSNKQTNTNTDSHTHTYLLIYTGDQIESLLALRQIERFNFSNRHNWHFARLQTNIAGNTTHSPAAYQHTHTHIHTNREATLGVTGQSRFSHHNGLLLVTPAHQGEGCRDYSTAIYLQLCVRVHLCVCV